VPFSLALEDSLPNSLTGICSHVLQVEPLGIATVGDSRYWTLTLSPLFLAIYFWPAEHETSGLVA
jgi:hypothetical protein